MSDQHEADESLPNPAPDETARLLREGSRSKVPAWKRLLPPWAFSIGLHLFVLPFVLGITVVFADSLFVPTVWNEVRDERIGDDPHFNLLIARDSSVEQVQERVVPLAKVADVGPQPTPAKPVSTGPVVAAKTTAPSTSPVSTTTQPMPSASGGSLIRGIVISAQSGQITVSLVDGMQCTLQADENTQVFREGDYRFFALEGGIAGIAPKTSVTITTFVIDGKNMARVVSVGAPAQPQQPQAGSNGKPATERPKEVVPRGDQDSTSNGSAGSSPYGFLGVAFTAEGPGVKVRQVIPDTGAYAAGVKEGDVILGVNGEKTEKLEAFMAAIRRHETGDAVTLKIHRDDKDIELKVTLGKPPMPSVR
jgi:hypothetical protein